MAPSAPPAPMIVCSSSMKSTTLPGREDLLHDPLQPLLELAAVLRSGHEGGEVEGEHPLADQHLGHRPVDDLLRETLHDGGLADARLADEDGIVLRPARARIWMTLWISFSRPMTGSSLFSRAKAVRSRPNSSRVGVGFFVGVGGFFLPACAGAPL